MSYYYRPQSPRGYLSPRSQSPHFARGCVGSPRPQAAPTPILDKINSLGPGQYLGILAYKRKHIQDLSGDELESPDQIVLADEGPLSKVYIMKSAMNHGFVVENIVNFLLDYQQEIGRPLDIHGYP